MEKLIKYGILLLVAIVMLFSCSKKEGFGNEHVCRNDFFIGKWSHSGIVTKTFINIDSVNERDLGVSEWTFTEEGYLIESNVFLPPDEWYIECNPDRLILVNPIGEEEFIGRSFYNVAEFNIESIQENRIEMVLANRDRLDDPEPYFEDNRRILIRID